MFSRHVTASCYLEYSTYTSLLVSDIANRPCWGREDGVDEDENTGAASKDERIAAAA